MKDSTKFEIAELNKILAKLKKRSSQDDGRNRRRRRHEKGSRKQLRQNGVAEVAVSQSTDESDGQRK